MKRILSAILSCILVLGCVFALASCNPNKDPEKAKEALEDAGYTVMLNEGEEGTMVTGRKDKDYVTIYYFEDKDDAKEFYDELKDEFEEAKEAAKEADEDFNLDIGKSGKRVWAGTKDAIKAAK